MQDQEKLLTADEVAERLSVTRQAVWTLVRNGEMTAVKVSDRRIRFHPADVEKWLTDRRAA